MQIKVSELKEVTIRLFHHLDELGIEEIEIIDDFYWSIQKEQLYDPYNKPDDLSLGQLSDDWNDLQKMLHHEIAEISFNLVDLAAILKAIGERVVI